jgi:hypothetical protein
VPYADTVDTAGGGGGGRVGSKLPISGRFICILMCIYMCTHTHKRTYARVRARAHTHTFYMHCVPVYLYVMCVCVCLFVCVCIHIHSYTHVRINIHIHTHVQTRTYNDIYRQLPQLMCVYIYTYIHTYIYTHKYIYTGSFHSITRLQAAVRRTTTHFKYSRMLVLSLAAHQQKRTPHCHLTMSVIDLQVRLLFFSSLSLARALSLSLSLARTRTHTHTHTHTRIRTHTHTQENKENNSKTVAATRAFGTGADEGDFSKAGARHQPRATRAAVASVKDGEARAGNAVRDGDLEDFAPFVEHRVVKEVLDEQEKHLQAEIERVRNEMPTTTLTSKQQGQQHVNAAGHSHVMESGSIRTPDTGVTLDTWVLKTSLESSSRFQAPAATSLPAFGAPLHVVESSPTNLSPREPWHSDAGGGRDGRDGGAAPGMLNARLEQLEDRLRLLDTPPPKVQKMGTDALWTIEMQLAELEKEDTRQRGDRNGAAKRELLLQRKHQEVQEREEEDSRLQRLRQKGYSGVPPQGWSDQRPYLSRASSTLQEREEEDARLQRPYLTRASNTLLALSARSLRDVTSHVTTLSADVTTSSANSIQHTTNTTSGMRK